jgi:hypothetical protein
MDSGRLEANTDGFVTLESSYVFRRMTLYIHAYRHNWFQYVFRMEDYKLQQLEIHLSKGR